MASTEDTSQLYAAIAAAADQYPKPAALAFTYGTAGFRTLGSKLPSVLFSVGLLAVLRSQRLNGATIGVMVTASHNPEADNGVKLVDPAGEMLEQSWEAYATTLANCATTNELLEAYKGIAAELNIDQLAPAAVVYAADTRPSSPELVKALETALGAFGSLVQITDLGVTTTPILHYVVKATNDKTGEYGTPTIDGYYVKMATAFKTLIGSRTLKPLFVDCANGVGAIALEAFDKHVGDFVQFKPLNTDTNKEGALNFQCGADFVKTKQQLPPSVAETGVLAAPETRGASFDGDADRIIYYYLKDGKTFRLLDGDKIAVLVALFIGDLVERAKLPGDGLKVGVVQTAYANGSSTKFIKSRGIPVTCTPTGVKHLHHAALNYDIGVYFEANGHGTVLFSDDAVKTFKNAEPSSPEEANAIKNLIALSELINQAVGDALSDLLLVEVVLAHRSWGAEEWDAGYEDLPNRLVKVEVADRFLFKTTDAERKLTSPEGLQELIDAAVNKVESGRSFVRPSGTEDCVRVYAEASTSALADGLAATVSELVKSSA